VSFHISFIGNLYTRQREETALSLPYHQTVRSWLLRCGLFLLRRRVPPRDDWVWILDHTIRIGQKKCLLILGASLDHLQAH